MEQWISDSVSSRRFQTLLLAMFAGLALALAALWIYGLMAYVAAQRTCEIGINETMARRCVTNDEQRNPNDERNPKSECRRQRATGALLEFRASDFFRISSFGFRHCPEILASGATIL